MARAWLRKLVNDDDGHFSVVDLEDLRSNQHAIAEPLIDGSNPTIITLTGGWATHNDFPGLYNPAAPEHTEFAKKRVDLCWQYGIDTEKEDISHITEGKHAVAAMVKRTECLVGGGPIAQFYEVDGRSIDFVGITWDDVEQTYHQRIAYNPNPRNFVDKEFYGIAKRLFLPLMVDTGGVCRSIEDIKKSFENITVMGASFGSVAGYLLANAILKVAEHSGFNRQELISENVLGSIAFLAVANTGRILRDGKGLRFTSLIYEGANDLVNEWVNPYKVTVPNELDGIAKFSLDHGSLIMLTTPWRATFKDVTSGTIKDIIDPPAHSTDFYLQELREKGCEHGQSALAREYMSAMAFRNLLGHTAAEVHERVVNERGFGKNIAKLDLPPEKKISRSVTGSLLPTNLTAAR